MIATLTQIGIAVVTAFLTTILVEIIAKPRLEARKERLIRDRRQIDEVIFGYQRLSMQLGAVVAGDRAPEQSLQREVHDHQVAELDALARDLLSAFSRLSPRYADRHAEHIGWAMRQLGFVQALAERSKAGFYVRDAELDRVATDLADFDVYFRVHVDFADSQEPLVKRLFWRRFTAKSYRQQAETTSRRYGGAERRKPDPELGPEDD